MFTVKSIDDQIWGVVIKLLEKSYLSELEQEEKLKQTFVLPRITREEFSILRK